MITLGCAVKQTFQKHLFVICAAHALQNVVEKTLGNDEDVYSYNQLNAATKASVVKMLMQEQRFQRLKIYYNPTAG